MNRLERFNNTLRQRLGRLIRKTLSFKTLSFSKSWENHVGRLRHFIHHYNLAITE